MTDTITANTSRNDLLKIAVGGLVSGLLTPLLPDAIDLLTLSTTPDRNDLADYYRRRAEQVDALVQQFAGVTPPADTAEDWPTVLAGLADYAEWARGIAAQVAADGLEVDQTPVPGLEAFRTLMRYGACYVLLDVN